MDSKGLSLLALGLAVTGIACGDDSGGDAADAGAAMVDAAGNAGDCMSQLVAGQTHGLPQAEGDRSFQGHAYFDSEGIWVVSSFVPGGVETIQIRALRLACDGSVMQEPVVVSPDNGSTHVEPRIAGYGDKVMIAWSSDDGVGPNNLSTHYRVFDRNAGPSEATTQHLDTQYMGASAGNTWMPELAAGPSGFAVAGLRGVSDYTSFQSFMQRVGLDGVMDGVAVDGELQDGLWQGQADVSVDDAGNATLAWQRTAEDETEHVVQVRIAAGAAAPDSAPIRMSLENGSQVDLGGKNDFGFYVVSGRAAGGVIVKPADAFDPNASELTLGGTAVGLYPKVAASEGGGLVAWLEGTMGVEAELHWQGFGFGRAGSVLTALGEEQSVTTESAVIGAYQLSVEHLMGQIFLVMWTEGPVSDLQARWQLVDMTPAGRQ